MEQALRGAMLIQLFCWRHQIDLGERFTSGTFFTVGELDALLADASKPFSDLHKPASPASIPLRSRRVNSASIGKPLRSLPTKTPAKAVRPPTVRNRLHYATSYLAWLGEREKSRKAFGAPRSNDAYIRAHEYGLRLLEMIEHIEERSPSGGDTSRMSLEPSQVAKLLEVTAPNSALNPWTDPFVRLRNSLIVRWLLGTGMRRGELLGLHVRDFNRGKAYCEIKRRHDDKRDNRRRQPNAKTLERLAPLDEQLVRLGEDYLKARRDLEVARKHGFLIVADDGVPLSENSISAMFALLRDKFPGVGPVSAHVLRHQWNEDFSAYADSIGMDPDEEARERSWLMGWGPASKMPSHYLKRRTKEKADEHVKAMQRRLMKHADEIGYRIGAERKTGEF
ncbi:tyrosine-type recombinase/integrase [Bosea thiooxidans]|nr:site-specific integrase [Bosea thiooxidans]